MITRKRLISGLVLIVVIVLVAWGLHARSNAAKASNASLRGRQGGGMGPVPVVSTTVVQQDLPIYLEGLGSVAAFNTVTVRSRVDGQLMKVAFTEGQEVHAGDLLAQIDPRPFELALRQAQAALKRDQAQLQLAKLTQSRNVALRNENLIAQEQLDQQNAMVAQTEATVQSDQTQVNNAKLQLEYASITAPLNGRTGVRLVDQGNMIHANDPNGLVVITQLDPIATFVTLPEDDLPVISEQLARHPMDAEAYSRDGKTRLADGKVALVDNQINPTAGTIKLKAIFPNPQRLLWPNQFVKVRLLITTRKNALVIPASVVQRGPDGNFAYVIKPDQTVEARPIEVGLTQGDLTLVEKGMQAGEQVVAEGQFRLRPGAHVAPAPSKVAQHKAEPQADPPSNSP